MSLENTNEDGTPMSQAQQFGNNEMVFSDFPSTPAQHITDGHLAFDDGSYLICQGGDIVRMTDAGELPARTEA